MISTCLKTELKTRIGTLTKKLFERQKLRAGEDKRRAIDSVTIAADEVRISLIKYLTVNAAPNDVCSQAARTGQGYLVLRLDVGLEPKALLEAITAVRKHHTELCILLLSPDQAKGKVFAVAVSLFELQ